MADISQMSLPDGNTYDIVDSKSRWEGTQAQYDALSSHDPNVIYYITDGVPGSNTTTEFTSSVTFVGTVGNSTHFYIRDNVVYMSYQGATGTHNADDTLFTLPSGYRPLGNLISPFTLNNTAYGDVAINSSTGLCKINFISSTTADGRIYFNISYPVA